MLSENLFEIYINLERVKERNKENFGKSFSFTTKNNLFPVPAISKLMFCTISIPHSDMNLKAVKADIKSLGDPLEIRSYF